MQYENDICRDYGSDSDSITLKQIHQIPGMSGDKHNYKAAGEGLDREGIEGLCDKGHTAVLECEVIECNVHEDIMGLPLVTSILQTTVTTIRNLAKYTVSRLSNTTLCQYLTGCFVLQPGQRTDRPPIWMRRN